MVEERQDFTHSLHRNQNKEKIMNANSFLVCGGESTGRRSPRKRSNKDRREQNPLSKKWNLKWYKEEKSPRAYQFGRNSNALR